MKTESTSREGNGRNGRTAAIRGAALKSLEGDALDRDQLLAALMSFKRGDFSVRLPVGLTGVDGKIADAFNDVVELERRDASRNGPSSAASAGAGRRRWAR